VGIHYFQGFLFLHAFQGENFTIELREGGEMWLYGGNGMKRVRVSNYYGGHVQGIGFRYSVKTLATGFEVSGIVRNLSDGRVELVAEGEKTELEAFLQAIRDSEVGRFIRHEQPDWSEARNGFRGFEITH
jgi:acylphosphatase